MSLSSGGDSGGDVAREEARRYEDVILEEARRAISLQASGLDELRSRTGVLLAAAAVSASFLGSATAKAGIGLEFWNGAALIFFALGVWSCMMVLLPKRDGWVFVNSPAVLVTDWVDTKRSESMPLFLAEALEESYDQNAKRLDGLYAWFGAAAICIGTSVVLGCIQLSLS